MNHKYSIVYKNEIGPRKLNIILTQLRCFASFLNYDLFQVNIVSDPSCRCGANREDSYHFFFAKVRVIEVRVNQMLILDKIIDKNVDVELSADNVFL
jgi:hypothetical protein